MSRERESGEDGENDVRDGGRLAQVAGSDGCPA